MINKIVFFNHFHNGDIHLSRTFVKKIIKLAEEKYGKIDFFYYHKNNPNLLFDIKNLKYDNNIARNINENITSKIDGSTLFINTWYGSEKFAYINKYGITFDCLYFIFNDICKKYFDLELKDVDTPENFFPNIDFSNLNLAHVDNKILPSNKFVLVANCKALSGQANNFLFESVISKLANKYHGIVFLLTNKETNNDIRKYGNGNVFYSSEFIQKSGFDLNEHAYLSKFCDVIIGRSSGAYTFCYNYDNLFKFNKKFVCFSNLGKKANWLGPYFTNKIHYSSYIKNIESFNLEIVEKEIEKVII